MPNRKAWLAVGIATALAACSDTTAPQFKRAGSIVRGGQMHVYSNTVKYRDTSKKPGTGRSGNATLSVMAMLGSDGKTDVEVRAGAPGNLTRAQFKLLDPNGVHQSTFSHNDLSAPNLNITLAGRARFSKVQVQANIRGVNLWRTGVVTVVETIKARPDATVAQVTAPASALVNEPVVVTALVRELNGDLGARANCVLYADGVAVDQAAGIWVDAGSAVNCVFSAVFDAAGPHMLRAAVEAVNPGDWNGSNNAAETQITIVDPQPASDFKYEASAYSIHSVIRYKSDAVWQGEDPMTGAMSTVEWGTDESWTEEVQEAKLTGTAQRAVSWPISFSIAQRTNGGTMHSLAQVDQSADFTWPVNGGTSARMRRFQQVTFYVGNQYRSYYPYEFMVTTWQAGDGSRSTTEISYTHFAGDVTYRSRGYVRMFSDGELVSEDNYYYNRDTSGQVPGWVAFGATVSFDVTVKDSDEEVLQLQTDVDMLPWENSGTFGPSCGFSEWGFGSESWCATQTWLETGVKGSKSGEPTR